MKKFIILLLFFITGCGVGCIEGSKGISGNSVIVEVTPKVNKVRNVLQPNWIDTGLRISKDQSPVKLTITGVLNMCPKDSLNPKDIIVSAATCNKAVYDVDYYNESIYENLGNTCKSAGSQSQSKSYFSTAARSISTFYMNKGDIFKVSLIPRKLKVEDCTVDALKEYGIIYYSDDEIFEDSNCNTAMSAENICKNGASKFYIKVEKECKESGEAFAGIPRLQGTEVSALVDNTTTPYGNKIFYDKSVEKDWIKAPFVYDARIIKNKKIDVGVLKKHCAIIKKLNEKGIISHVDTASTSQLEYYKKQQEQGNIEKDVTLDTIKEIIDIVNNFTTYDINCICGTICNSKSQLIADKKIATISNYGADGNCVTENSKVDMNVTLDEISKTSLEDIAKNSDSEQIIQGLSAYFDITPKSGMKKSLSKNYYCFPKKTYGHFCYAQGSRDIESSSLKPDFNYTYEHDDRMQLRFVILGAESAYGLYSGGYNIHVERICNFMYGKKLYMYIGDNAPTMFPGDKGTVELFVPNPKDQTSGTGVYMINGNGSEKKSGKIYLGIDVRGYEDQFDYSSLPGMESENKYFADFFVKVWNPNFSKAFVMIRDTLLRILYGLPKDVKVDSISQAIDVIHTNKSKGAVQSIYTNQTSAGSLWRALQALCTLYIIFTVLGYIIGVIKCTKYDLVVRIAKIAVVVGLISQGSWEFFSDHFFSIFVQGVSDLIAAFNGELDGDNSFAFLDPTIGVLLTGEVWIRLATLIITGPIGWLMFIIILWAFIVFFICIIEAVIAYLFTIVGIAFLATLAPIFITFVFFQLTKTLFDSWIKMLVNFSLQPIILFAALAFLNQVMLTVLYSVTGFTVCSQCYLGFNIPIGAVEKGAPPDICLIYVLAPIGYSPALSITESIREAYVQGGRGLFGLPFSVASVLMLLIVANAMRGFKNMSETIAHSISGSVAGLGASIHAATQSLASIVGLDQETQSIIKDAIRNRRSTGKSDINIVSRSNINPENKGESIEKSGDHGSDSTPRNHNYDVQTDNGTSSKPTDISQQPQSGDSGKEDRRIGGHDDGRLNSYISSPSDDVVLDVCPSYDKVQGVNNNLDANSPISRSESTTVDDTNVSGITAHDLSNDSGSERRELVDDSIDNISGMTAHDLSNDSGSERRELVDDSTDNISDITAHDLSNDSGSERRELVDDSTDNISGMTAHDLSNDSGSERRELVDDSTDNISDITAHDLSNDSDSERRELVDDSTDNISGMTAHDLSNDSGSERRELVDDSTDNISDITAHDPINDSGDINERGELHNAVNDDILNVIPDIDESKNAADVSTSDSIGYDIDDQNLGNVDSFTDDNESTTENNDSDTQVEAEKASVIVESYDDADVNGRKGRRKDINFLDGPQRKRLYMDEHSSVAEKIAGHESAIKVEEESYERGIVRRLDEKNQQE
ncbi:MULTISPECIES: type IV secretion system protein [Ehrlichia]|uniref:TrbL/VirB6 plasmid conjugal transfer family protein n=1 Tax=Ehrlichia cf. muris str. EmCRT TaxID=1359167 RepID=A0A0F3NEP1_9RICK|nr:MULTISPECIES: type IV secretion system protein [Ehrlichia]KJV65389.1 trbL/VirB6 plasmid conjugal transfer family protein [Ehrlichia cf. muris str. EmCRT]OUC04661.1 conjugal transfer protein TrbL [Ehrlichia sp. Wisconsin_h]